MGKHNESVYRRNLTIERLQKESLTEMIEDFDELLNEDEPKFETPIQTDGYDSWYDVHGITLMADFDEDGEVIDEKPSFYIGAERHMEYVENIPYDVVLNVYNTVFGD